MKLIPNFVILLPAKLFVQTARRMRAHLSHEICTIFLCKNPSEIPAMMMNAAWYSLGFTMSHRLTQNVWLTKAVEAVIRMLVWCRLLRCLSAHSFHSLEIRKKSVATNRHLRSIWLTHLDAHLSPLVYDARAPSSGKNADKIITVIMGMRKNIDKLLWVLVLVSAAAFVPSQSDGSPPTHTPFTRTASPQTTDWAKDRRRMRSEESAHTHRTKETKTKSVCSKHNISCAQKECVAMKIKIEEKMWIGFAHKHRRRNDTK